MSDLVSNNILKKHPSLFFFIQIVHEYMIIPMKY